MTSLSRRSLIAAAGLAAAPVGALGAGPMLTVSGKPQQGGAVIGRTRPRATVVLVRPDSEAARLVQPGHTA